MQIDENFLARAKGLIDEAQEVVITNHVNPDGDAVGSALAIAALLQAYGKSVTVVMPNNYPDNLKWLSGSDQVVFFDKMQVQATDMVEQADLIVHLDYNSLKRSGEMQDVLSKCEAKKIVIDHHQQPDDFADALYSDVNMSSTCEMVYHFAMAMQWHSYVDITTSEALYTGIATDTGNFRFNSTTPATHRAVAFLIEKGVKPGHVASLIYDSNRTGRLKLLSRALDRMEVLEDYRTALISLTPEELEKFNYEKGDTEGFVNYGLSLDKVEFSAFIYEKNNKVKMSFRSKTNFDVNTFAREHFNGGGHLNAAGALSDLNLEETLEKFKKILPQYADVLQNKQPLES